MRVNISIEGKKEFERILTILELGLLTALENNLITIDESEGYLFNPYTIKILRQNEINSSIIDVIHQACELEDVESLLPDKLLDNIIDLKKESIRILESLQRPNIPVEKLIKEIVD